MFLQCAKDYRSFYFNWSVIKCSRQLGDDETQCLSLHSGNRLIENETSLRTSPGRGDRKPCGTSWQSCTVSSPSAKCKRSGKVNQDILPLFWTLYSSLQVSHLARKKGTWDWGQHHHPVWESDPSIKHPSPQTPRVHTGNWLCTTAVFKWFLPKTLSEVSSGSPSGPSLMHLSICPPVRSWRVCNHPMCYSLGISQRVVLWFGDKVCSRTVRMSVAKTG